jgi:hypothetical protein
MVLMSMNGLMVIRFTLRASISRSLFWFPTRVPASRSRLEMPRSQLSQIVCHNSPTAG